MGYHLLNLHLSQCEVFLGRSKNNNYSDKSKKDYQDLLFSLFEDIKASVNPSTDIVEIFEKQEQLNFIFKSLEFLKDSTLNSIPFEVVSCLNLAMEDWIDTNAYIIVTSLNNNIAAYSYDPSLAFEDLLYNSMEVQYNISFPKRLVQINVPLALSRDYFSSVVLYHELGHFIDIYYNISKIIAFDLSHYNDAQWQTLEPYFSFTPDIEHFKQNQDFLKSHIAEYFCDVFASQYIGNTSNNYLEYITKNSPYFSFTHPSTINRVKIVDDFLNNTQNPIVDLLTAYTLNITGKQIGKRHTTLNSWDFYKFVPIEIKNESELHGVFPYFWDIWLKGNEDFKVKSKVSNGLPHDKLYKMLNNLTEKTIGNYFIEKDWELTKQK